MGHIATRQQFSRNLVSGWMLLVAEVAVAFVLTPLVIRHLGAATYGVWSLMIGVVGYMGLIDVGIRGSVGRYVNHYMALRDADAVSQVVGTANVILSGLGLLAVLVAIGVAQHFSLIFPKTPAQLTDAVRLCLPLMAFNMWLAFLSSVTSNVLAAKEALYLNNNFNLALLLLRAGCTVWVMSAGFGIEGLMVVNVVIAVLTLLLLNRTARRVLGADMPRLIAFSTERLREMWRFGIASFVGRTASTLANDSAPLIGMWLLGPEAVAIYSVAMMLAQYSRRVMDQAASAIFGSVMKAGAMKDYAGLRTIHLRFMDVSFAIGSLIFIGLMVFGQSFLRLWVGETYAAGALAAGILALGYLMQAVASTAPLALASLDRVNTTMKIGIGEAVACIVLSAALPGLFGLGLAGLALGATLPRLFSNLVIYPHLTVSVLGAEIKPALVRGVLRNLLLCMGVGMVFIGIEWLLPGRSWALLIGSVALAAVLHFLAFATRYEALPMFARLNTGVRRAARSLQQRFTP